MEMSCINLIGEIFSAIHPQFFANVFVLTLHILVLLGIPFELLE